MADRWDPVATVLVTGVAGFIGSHTALRLLERGDAVVGVDSLIGADRALQAARLDRLTPFAGFRFLALDLADRRAVAELFAGTRFDAAIHLAARAGVRASLAEPDGFVDSNLVGFVNVLEGCRRAGCPPLTYASSSSVYGAGTALPYREDQPVDHPVSLYAATKRTNELLAHAYSHDFGLPTTGLRFFTVYGPWGRPDMALSLFTRAILEERPIDVFNQGQMRRDFTYIDDIVDGVLRAAAHPASPDPAWSGQTPCPATAAAPFRLYNLGNGTPVPLLGLITLLEGALGRRAELRLQPMQTGDVVATWADSEAAARDLGWRATTPIEVGIEHFARWYLDFHTDGP